MELNIEKSQEIVDALKAKRYQANHPVKSLLNLSIKFIIDNYKLFVNQDENLFQNLPFTIVRQFFDIFVYQNNSTDKSFLPLILQMMNSNFEVLEENYGEKLTWLKENYYTVFHHLLHNCPKIKRIHLEKHLYVNSISKEELFQTMATNWQKLRDLTINEVCISDEDTLKLLEQYVPGLECLKFSCESPDFGDIPTCVSMNGVEHLSQMKKLKSLALNLHRDIHYNEPVWAHAAGRIPSLQILCLEKGDDQIGYHSSLFVENYGQLYPNKPLHLKIIGKINFILQNEWPQNVTVDNLFLLGSTISLESLGSISKTRKLDLCEIPSSLIYKIMEKFGPFVTELHINTGRFNGPLNLYQVFKDSPYLEEVDIIHTGPLESNTKKIRFLNHQFQNCHGLEIKGSEGKQACFEISKIFKILLLNSEQLLEEDSFQVNDESMMRATLDVLRQGPCIYLSQLVWASLYCSENVQAETRDEYLELVYRLMANSTIIQFFEITFYLSRLEIETGLEDLRMKCTQLMQFADATEIQNLIMLKSHDVPGFDQFFE